MRLTPFQRKLLERYQSYRESPPTLWKLIAFALPNHFWLLVFLSLLAVILYLYAFESVFLIWWIMGVGIGAISRDIGHFRAVLRLWPVISQVLDYQKIDEALEQPLDS